MLPGLELVWRDMRASGFGRNIAYLLNSSVVALTMPGFALSSRQCRSSDAPENYGASDGRLGNTVTAVAMVIHAVDPMLLLPLRLGKQACL